MFPEGTRRPVGAPPAYHTGIALLYRTLGVPVVPVALNSGVFWPRKSFLHYPGTVSSNSCRRSRPASIRGPSSARLQETIESASDRLVAEAPRRAENLRAANSIRPECDSSFGAVMRICLASLPTNVLGLFSWSPFSRTSSPISPRKSPRGRGSATAFIISAGFRAAATCSRRSTARISPTSARVVVVARRPPTAASRPPGRGPRPLRPPRRRAPRAADRRADRDRPRPLPDDRARPAASTWSPISPIPALALRRPSSAASHSSVASRMPRERRCIDRARHVVGVGARLHRPLPLTSARSFARGSSPAYCTWLRSTT